MKTVLITGCSSGFGRLTAELLAANNMRVLAGIRNAGTDNKEVADELKTRENIEVIDIDLASVESIRTAVKNLENGTIDILINNAGVCGIGFAEMHEVEKVKKIFDVNVFGTYELTRLIIPKMREQQSGLIITVTSIVGRVVMPNWTAYAASKFAAEAMAETWRYELAPLGIESVIVEPGPHPTTGMGMKMAPYSAGMPDMEIFQQYGPVAGAIQQFHEQLQKDVASGNFQQPQNVADAVLELIKTPSGKRDFRTVVDKQMQELLSNLNSYTDKMYQSMFMS